MKFHFQMATPIVPLAYLTVRFADNAAPLIDSIVIRIHRTSCVGGGAPLPATIMLYSIHSPSSTPTEGAPEAGEDEIRIEAQTIMPTIRKMHVNDVFFML